MSNQLHGKTFEDIIKSEFRGSADHGRKTTSIFDIESCFDKKLNLNTSIKVTKLNKYNNETFPLSDARRIFSINEDFRMIIGFYEQVLNVKVFSKIIEYIIRKEDFEKLKGALTLAEVSDFHEGLRSFEVGKHRQARLYHRKIKPSLQLKTNIILNPKIDSKNQRRLQCSIKRKVLESVLNPEQIIEYNDFYNNLVLPLKFKSEKRILLK